MKARSNSETGTTKLIRGFEEITRYWDSTNDVTAAKIKPGQYYVTNRDEMIVTVLGSCVAACIRDCTTGVGGMNHFMLPTTAGSEEENWRSTCVSAANRYGNFAMENLVNEILKNGGGRGRLEVKLFGGGRILASMSDIGARNIDFVREYIRREGLKLAAEDLGDVCPRRVYFFPATGVVRVKRLRSLENDTVVRREQAYGESIESGRIEGEFDLF